MPKGSVMQRTLSRLWWSEEIHEEVAAWGRQHATWLAAQDNATRIRQWPKDAKGNPRPLRRDEKVRAYAGLFVVRSPEGCIEDHCGLCGAMDAAKTRIGPNTVLEHFIQSMHLNALYWYASGDPVDFGRGAGQQIQMLEEMLAPHLDEATQVEGEIHSGTPEHWSSDPVAEVREEEPPPIDPRLGAPLRPKDPRMGLRDKVAPVQPQPPLRKDRPKSESSVAVSTGGKGTIRIAKTPPRGGQA